MAEEIKKIKEIEDKEEVGESEEAKENVEEEILDIENLEEEKIEEKKLKSIEELEREKIQEKIAGWKPKTRLGKEIKEGKIKNIDEILDKRLKILEPEIVDSLLSLENDILLIGQSKGKFGGGKRRAWKQTQKKTMEGNVPTFSAMIVVGDKAGHVGLGRGKASETLPARTKALRKAKLNIIKVNRGCGSFDCSCNELHSIPFKVEGKSGSCKIILYPAPQGTGLVIGDECKRILRLAGIKDVYSKSFGSIRTTINFAQACIDALEKLNLNK